MEKQHVVLWRGPCSTHRQGREPISGPDLAGYKGLITVLYYNTIQDCYWPAYRT